MSNALKRFPLPYSQDMVKRFGAWCEQPWSMLLDSGKPSSEYGRYDIFVADPVITIETEDLGGNASNPNTLTTITTPEQVEVRTENPFDLLNAILKQHPVLPAQEEIPFAGGAMGYFAYDLGRVVEKLPTHAKRLPNSQVMMVGIYDWAVVVDHRKQTATLVSYACYDQTEEEWETICQRVLTITQIKHTPNDFKVTSNVGSNMDYAYYAKAFARIKDYIHAGDCYQVNLAQRFSASCEGSAWQAYAVLRELSAAPFMAYMHFNDFQVLSASPERFLQIVDGHVETRPIKGTRPRDEEPSIDLANAEQLQNSVKDRAENLMIVDLLRNDISKHCATGTVKADKLFQLQSFSNVHHLVSIVTGQLEQDKTAIDLLHGAFPGGSITGAPKLRSMEIIEELEPHRRGIYCGSIGYIGFDGNMDTNITIRTVVIADGDISFYAGGGIVADSELEKEYNETLDKAANMLALLKQFKAT